MRHRMILALLFFAFCSSQSFAAGPSGFAVNVLVDDAPRAEYVHRGTVYIEAVRGASYSLRITNPTPYRVAVALSVDGLNTIDAKHTDARNASKWVLEPYESTVISGWQVSNRAARVSSSPASAILGASLDKRPSISATASRCGSLSAEAVCEERSDAALPPPHRQKRRGATLQRLRRDRNGPQGASQNRDDRHRS